MEIPPREHPSLLQVILSQERGQAKGPGSCQLRAAVRMQGMHLAEPELSEHVLSS